MRETDPTLIGRVHEMKFPAHTELMTSLKCEKHVNKETAGNATFKKFRNRKLRRNGMKIDLTKIFCRCTRMSEVQLWISVEDASAETTQKENLPPAFIKFSGIQLAYERIVNKPKL